MKRRHFTIAALLFCVVAISVFGVTIARMHTIADIPTPNKTPHLQIYISGKNFTPNQEYVLTFTNGNQLIVKTTAEGELNTSPILPFDMSRQDIFFVTIEEKDAIELDAPTMEVLFNTHNKTVSWKGHYFQPSEKLHFSISNKNGLEENTSRTDWNGHFKHDIDYADINLMKEITCLKTENSMQELCLSFGVHRSPQITEVLTPGPSVMGNADDDPFTFYSNWMEPSDCTPSPFSEVDELSLCQESHIGGLQEDLMKVAYDFSRMTLQLSAGMMQQVGFIGTLFDAKHQLETQLLFWEKQEQAHDDYHPSEQLCSIASMTKGLAGSEARRAMNTFGLNRALAYEDQNPANSNSAEGPFRNYQWRILQFKEHYCAPTNMNNSLSRYCKDLASGNFARMNRDIDFTNLINNPKTLEVDITDGIDGSADEQDIISMGRLLFGHKAMDWPQPENDDLAEDAMNDPDFINRYQEYRSISAIRNVARHSFANIVGMKSEGSGFVNTEIQGLLTEFGMTGTDIEQFVGENPSYFAQMHMLTKQIFQHPNFYTNLITKEANIERFKVTMEAMHLMSKREQYEAALRKELLLSLLVEMKLRDLQEYGVDAALRNIGSRRGPRL